MQSWHLIDRGPVREARERVVEREKPIRKGEKSRGVRKERDEFHLFPSTVVLCSLFTEGGEKYMKGQSILCMA